MSVLPFVDLVVTVADAPDPVILNSNLLYSVMITNRGVSIGQGVTLTDTLPDRLTAVTVSRR